jgi:hypothetical protein
MRRPMRPELSPPRTLSKPAGPDPGTYRPWVEVGALVRVAVAGWNVAETAWVHWAMPLADGRADVDRAFAFDLSRRAATPGEPAVGARAGRGDLDLGQASRVCELLAARWAPRLHFHPELRLASRLDESIESFRRRCLALSAPALRKLNPAHRAVEVARLGAAIESREVGAGELQVVRWRVGVGWYPSGVEPAAEQADPMMLGP